jgi:hypothetical protein
VDAATPHGHVAAYLDACARLFVGEVDVHVLQHHGAATRGENAGGPSAVAIDLHRAQGDIAAAARLRPYRRTAAGVFNTHAFGQQGSAAHEQPVCTAAVDLDDAVA